MSPLPIGLALEKARASDKALPEVPAFRALYAMGCRPREGQLLMIAGMPGSFKSAFAMYLTAKMDVPTLYLSLDTSQATAFIRVASIATAHTGDDVYANIHSGNTSMYEDALRDSQLTFSFTPDMDLGDVQEELDSYVEMYDRYPTVVVVDNLTDLTAINESENQSYRDLLKEFKAKARETGAAIVVLHHMTEGIGDSTKPSPRKALLQKVGQTPEVVLSVAVEGDQFKVAVVKNRNGPQDPSGQTFARMRVDPERTSFYPLNPTGGGW